MRRNDPRFSGLSTQPVTDGYIVERQLRLLPAGGCSQMFRGAHSCPFVFGHHCKEIAVSDQSYAIAE